MKAELISVFDGYINEGAGELDSKLTKIEKELEGVPEKKLEEQVYKRFEYLVCVACRDNIDNFLTVEDSL